MIVIVVDGGVVKAVYADKVDMPIDVKVLDLDNEKGEGVPRSQMDQEVRQIEREMEKVL